MTINLLTQIPEGLVMLTDSMISSQRRVDGEMERIAFEHARKLFHLGEKSPAAVMLNGVANIGSSLVSQLIRDASADLDTHKNKVNHEVCLQAIIGRVSPKYDSYIARLRKESASELTSNHAELGRINKQRKKAKRVPLSSITPDRIAVRGIPRKTASIWEITPPEFTLVIASYFAEPLATELTWPNAARRDIIKGSGSGVWWWGSGGVPLMRLIKGVDYSILGSDVAHDDARVALEYFQKQKDRFSMNLALDVMPVQQAIYFTEYLAAVAAGYDRFQIGPHYVGGEMDVIAMVDGKSEVDPQTATNIQSKAVRGPHLSFVLIPPIAGIPE